MKKARIKGEITWVGSPVAPQDSKGGTPTWKGMKFEGQSHGRSE